MKSILFSVALAQFTEPSPSFTTSSCSAGAMSPGQVGVDNCDVAWCTALPVVTGYEPMSFWGTLGCVQEYSGFETCLMVMALK